MHRGRSGNIEAKAASSIAVWADIRSMGSARAQDQIVMNGFGTRPRGRRRRLPIALGKAATERDTKTARTGRMKSYEQRCRRPPHRRRISVNNLVAVVSAP